MAAYHFDLQDIVKRLNETASNYCNEGIPSSLAKLHSEARAFLWPLSRYIQQAAPPTLVTELANALTEEILQKLSDGVIRRYINELKMTNNIESQDFSLVILSLEALFMELSYELKIQELLIRVGVVHLLFQQLKLLYRLITVNREMRKFILAPALIISNCVQNYADFYMSRHGGTNTTGLVNILEPYFVSTDPLVASCVKFIRNNLSRYLYKTHPELIECPDHIKELLQYLFQSFSPTPITATAISLEPTEVLCMLEKLCVSHRNRIVLLENSNFPSAMSHLLEGASQPKEVMIATLNLILSILSPSTIPLLAKANNKKTKDKSSAAVSVDDTEASSLLLNSLPHLIAWLTNLNCSHSQEIQELSDSVLFTLGNNIVFSSTHYSMLLQCYNHKHYELVVSLPTKDEEQPHSTTTDCKLVKMKARYRIYCRDQIILQQKEKDLRIFELSNARHQLYDEARKIVPYFVKSDNKEAKTMLDHMLMDLTRDLNEKSGVRGGKKGQNSFFNCLLCHKPDTIVKGHFWARSHLLAIRGDEKKFIKDRSGLHKTPDLKGVGGMIYFMFCTTCDNCLLSVDENFFSDNIVRVIYPELNSHFPTLEHAIPYKGPSLYRFCLGLAFRALALQKGTFHYTNSSTVYNVMQSIRRVLLATNDDDQTELSGKIDVPIALLFFTPAKVSNEEASEGATSISIHQQKDSLPGSTQDASSSIADVLQDASNIINDPFFIDGSDFSRISYLSLYSDKPSYSEKAHFVIIKEGIFNFVVLLERAEILPEHQKFIINPSGDGTLYIPRNDQRMSLLPSGIVQTYKERVPSFIKDLMELDSKVSRLNSVRHVSEKSSLIDSFSIPEITQQSAGSLQVPTTNSVIEYNINLLPIKHSIDRTSNRLYLPSNHTVLLHHTQYGEYTTTGQTVLLIIDDSNTPYAIVHTFTPNMAISLGYYVSPDDFSFMKRLTNENHKGMESLIQGSNKLISLASYFVPIALKRSDLVDFNSLMLFHQSGFSVDRKCLPGYGCWYCSLSCEVCRTPHVYGSIIKSLEEILYKFCSQDCLDLYANIFDEPNNEESLNINTESDSELFVNDNVVENFSIEKSSISLQDYTAIKEVPQDSTEVPQLDSTEVAHDSTEVPQDSTEAPQDSTVVPQDSTEVPQDSTETPQEVSTILEEIIQAARPCIVKLDVIISREVYPQFNDAVLLMTISGLYQLIDGTRVSVTMKLFHHDSSTAECGIKYLPTLAANGSNTYFVICRLQLILEQYLQVYSLSIGDDELHEPVYQREEDSNSILSLGQRKQLLSIVLQDGVCKSNLESLALLLS